MTFRNAAMASLAALTWLTASGSGLADMRLRTPFDPDSMTSTAVIEALDPSPHATEHEASVRIAPGFAPGSAELPETAKEHLKAVAEALVSQRLRDVLIVIEGHTDASGEADRNQRLSVQRAVAVAEHLATLGVKRSRLALRGAGEDDPLAGIDPEASIQRRVEFVRRFRTDHGSDDFITGSDGCGIQPVLAAHGLSVLRALALTHENPVFSPEGLRSVLEILDWGASERARSLIGKYYLSGLGEQQDYADGSLPLSKCAAVMKAEADVAAVETASMDLVLLRDGLALTHGVALAAAEHVPPVEVQVIPESGFAEWIETVNQEIEDATDGRIADALDLDGDEDLVVANVFSMNAPWLVPFDEARTQPAGFTTRKGSRVTVPTMVSEERAVLFAEDDAFIRVLLPYADADHYMHLIRPRNDVDVGDAALSGLLPRGSEGMLGLRTTESSYGDRKIIDWSGETVRAVVHLPSFDVRGETDIGAHMKAAGFAELFSDPGAFAGLTGDEMLLSRIAQSVRVRTDEAGSETGAVSIAVTGRSGRDEPVREIRFNRAFLYVVGQASSGAILAMGIVGNPLEGS